MKRPRLSRYLWLMLVFCAAMMPSLAKAQSQGDPLYCGPNEGNTFPIQSGATFDVYGNCGTTTIVTPPVHGTLIYVGYDSDEYRYKWTYTATAGYTGADTFTVHVSSSIGSAGGQGNFGGGPGNETITLNVLASPPTVSNASASTAFNTATGIDLSSHITGTGITAVTVATGPAHGSTSVSGEVVTYTPAVNYYGSDSFTYTATNTGGTSSPATVAVTVATPPVPATAARAASTPYNTAKTIDLTSSITGVDITAVTVASAPSHGTTSVSGEVVTYTPSSTYYGGTDTFTYTATNPGGTSTASTVTVTVEPSPTPTAVTLVPAETLTVQQPSASFKPVTGSGGIAPFSYSVSPGLPAGLTLSSSTGSISGVPTTASTQATYTVTATDTASRTASSTFTLAVSGTISATTAVSTTTLTQNKAATAFTPVTATGGTGTLTYSVSPALPAGLTLSTTTGAISGTPTSVSAATTYTVTATDTNLATGTATFSLTVSAAITLTPTVSAATLTKGQPVTTFSPVTATGGSGTLTYAVSPALPAGLAYSASAGTISGTPTVVSAAATYTVTATDTNGQARTAAFTLSVASSVSVMQAIASKTIALNQPVTPFTPVTGTGGTGALTYSISPSLPSGLTISSSTGVISGTPTVAIGATTFTVTVTDANGESGSATISLTVQSVPSSAAQTAATTSGSTAWLHVTANAAGAPFTAVTITSQPSSGKAVVSGLDIIYIPDPTITSTQTVTINFTITNVYGTSSPITVTITITPKTPQVSRTEGPPVPRPTADLQSAGGAA